MPIVIQPIPRPAADKPRRVLIAEDMGTDRDALDAHLAAARDAENAAIRETNRNKPEEDQAAELTAETVAALIDGMHRSTVRGLVNHVRTLTEPADLDAWRRAWPKVLIPLSDEEASAVIRAADVMARDETVMPEHRPKAARQLQSGPVRVGGASGAAVGRVSGPGVPIKVNRGG